jgi:predicted AlkP superfamily pyrophosphatase or phosphodiesterase
LHQFLNLPNCKEKLVIKRISAMALGLALLGATLAPRAAGQESGQYSHVLLISVDGLHALDVANYVQSHPNSAMAELAGHGITYSNARTPSNSDSFPGLLALVTGGSPLSHGLFYDVSYNRSIFDPTNTKCQGQPGTQQVFDESIDVYDANNVSQNVIDPAKLPRYLHDGQCLPKFPHNAIRVNTIFEVVKASGGVTAWADKHPAYDLVNGPSGKGVDDLYTPELTNVGGFDNTVSVVCTVQNDFLKVKAVLNEIKGLRDNGTPGLGIPTVLGMNFQAVSAGQKLSIDNKAGGCPNDAFTGQIGGYTDGAGTPTAVLAYGLQKTDEALGMMIRALKAQHIYDSTLFIVTAKHGQSPINPAKVNKPGHFADLVAATATATGTTNDPGAIAIANANNCPTPAPTTGPCGFVQDDDIALLWLGDQSQTGAVATYLNKFAASRNPDGSFSSGPLFIDEVMAGNDLALKFNDPATDPAVPDIIVQPVYGTIYTGSTAKNAEHGGFSIEDTNVGLIVSNPGLSAAVVKTPVASSQVAPSILKALGLNPSALQAVQKEGTAVLPFLFAQ